MNIILASGSPRRREILSAAGIEFTVKTADIEETMDKILPPDVVRDLAIQKAAAVNCADGDAVIAADTVVSVDGKILGKPKDEEDAKNMLRMLSGRMHEVYTGVCVRCGNMSESFSERTEVYFKKLSEKQIENYVKTGEPMDKAGAYGIQGKGALLITHICGDFFNVVGLPVSKLYDLLERSGCISE